MTDFSNFSHSIRESQSPQSSEHLPIHCSRVHASKILKLEIFFTLVSPFSLTFSYHMIKSFNKLLTCFPSCIFYYRLHFLEQFWDHTDIKHKVQRLPVYLPRPHKWTISPTISISCLNGTLALIEEHIDTSLSPGVYSLL